MDEPPSEDSARSEIVLDPVEECGSDRLFTSEADLAHGLDWTDENDPFFSLEALADWIEADDGDSLTSAIDGLASVEPETRVRILEGLGELPPSIGLLALFRAFADSSDEETRMAARNALGWDPLPVKALNCIESNLPFGDVAELDDDKPESNEVLGFLEDSESAKISLVAEGPANHLPVVDSARLRRGSGPSLARSLVSAVDGRGAATIAVSSIHDGMRRSAVFRCNVLEGVADAYGRIEEELSSGGSLIDGVIETLPEHQARLEDVSELASSLLAGVLILGPDGTDMSSEVRFWVDEVFGVGFQPRPIPIPTFAGRHGQRGFSAARDNMPRQAQRVLKACPSWIDVSPLTFELAEEIELREGNDRKTDPIRHSGAYRYLFEHNLIHRLELYRRMLLWMAWFWRFGGDVALSDSAIAIAAELSDEQYAVPSHPFTVALTTRSFDEARLRLRSRERSVGPKVSRKKQPEP